MKRLLAKLALVIVVLATSLHAAQTLDRIVATVNHNPILASDIDDEARFEALQEGKHANALDEDRRAVLNRVIERELICQQMPTDYDPSHDSIDKQISELRLQFPAAKTDQQWDDVLAAYGFDRQSLQEMVKLQLRVVHFLDVRLRPTVRVDRDEISDYYSNKLLPKLKAAGASIDPLDKLSDRIAEVLMQQKMTEVFNAWIANLRTQGDIRILDSSLAPPAITTAEKGTRTSQ